MGDFDRSLPRQRPGVIRYEVNRGESYGNLPADALMRKFEETNMGPDDNLYDDYARLQLMDQRPDATKFESEQPRGAVNRSSGMLQHRYYGHRGCADYERPEMFLGFAGPEERDPRGVNVDPDARKLVAQAEARRRFIRFSPDDSQNTTGGGRSEGQLQRDQQSLFRWTRERLKVFSRQHDGRREGLRRDTYRSVSNVKKQIQVQGYGDYIRDYALNPQRRANIICQRMIRDSKAWREGTADADWQIAKYTQICRRSAKKDTYQRVLGAQNNDDTVWTDADPTLAYKTMGMLMASIINARRTRSANVGGSDRDYADAQLTVARRTAPLKKDLELIMYMTSGDGDMSTGDESMMRRTPEQRRAEHLVRQVVLNHLQPAHHYLNADIIYKSLKQSRDFREIRGKVITDAKTMTIDDLAVLAAKTARRTQVNGARLQTTNDDDRTESKDVFSYKRAAKIRGDSVQRVISGHDFAGTSDISQARRTPNVEYRAPSTGDIAQNEEFSDNTSKDRMTRAMGSKYTTPYIARDGATTLADLS